MNREMKTTFLILFVCKALFTQNANCLYFRNTEDILNETFHIVENLMTETTNIKLNFSTPEAVKTETLPWETDIFEQGIKKIIDHFEHHSHNKSIIREARHILKNLKCLNKSCPSLNNENGKDGQSHQCQICGFLCKLNYYISFIFRHGLCKAETTGCHHRSKMLTLESAFARTGRPSHNGQRFHGLQPLYGQGYMKLVGRSKDLSNLSYKAANNCNC